MRYHVSQSQSAHACLLCRVGLECLNVVFGGFISREKTFQMQLLKRNVAWGTESGDGGKKTQCEFSFAQLDREHRCLQCLPVRHVPGSRYARIVQQLIEQRQGDVALAIDVRLTMQAIDAAARYRMPISDIRSYPVRMEDTDYGDTG